MDDLKRSKWIYILVLILLVGLIITVYDNISFIFNPLLALIQAVFLPVILAVFTYYIFLPVYQFLSKRINNDHINIALTMLTILACVIILVLLVGPSLVNQAQSFLRFIPSLIQQLYYAVDDFLIQMGLTPADMYALMEEVNLTVSNLLNAAFSTLTNTAQFIVSNTITFLIAFFTFPLILFYLYKDGADLRKNLIAITPKPYKDLTDQVSRIVHDSASNYIGSRMTVVLFMTLSSLLIYSVLDLENALFLAIFNGLFDIIPYFGPWIGAAPAFFIALIDSPIKGLYVVILVFILQQIESALITPMVMGYNMKIHPVTTVLLVLFAGEFAGILGMIFVLPIFAIIKNVFKVVLQYHQQGKETP